MRRRFWIETVTSLVSLAGALLTLVWKDWIERLTGFNPDGHGGVVEWLIVAALLLIAVSAAWPARAEWRRAHPGTA